MPKALFFLFLIIILPNNSSKGCGPFVGEGEIGYSFVSPRLVAEAAAPAPFLLDFKFSEIYQYFGTEEYRQEQANVKEWQQRVCESAKLEDIRYVVYGTDMNELLALQNKVREPTAALPLSLKDNDFADYLLDLKCDETLDYLVFAKRCEPHVISYADIWEKPERNYDAMTMLIDEGKQHFKRTKSQYIRLRYAYQVVRLAHYMKNYELTLDLYNYFIPKIDDTDSLIYFWLQGHRAGALRAIGQNVEASYLYTVVFKNCPNRRESAYRSFLIRSDAEWDACYLMCKDDGERAALYAIRAGAADGRVLEEMNRIYSIDPKSDFLELLLVREIRKLEASFLGYPVGGVRPHQRVAQIIPKDTQGKYVIDLQEFARKCRTEEKVKNKALWQIAEGYLEFLAGDYYKASKTIDEVQRYVESEQLKDQLKVMAAILQLATIDEIDADVEDELLEILKNRELFLNYPDFRKYFNDRVANLYLQAGRPGLAFRAHYRLSDARYNPDMNIVNDLLASLDKEKDPTKFELLLGQDTLGSDARLELLNIKATYYMAEGKLKQALDVWKLMDRADWRKFGEFNPFPERIRDCVHCDAKADDRGIIVDTLGSRYSKGEILERILNSDRDARLGGEGAAQLFYNIGSALYNMSYFGHAWKATDFFRSGASNSSWNLAAKNGVVQHWEAPFGNKENFNVSLARSYFEEAYNEANTQGNTELAAKAAFMAAKCEQKQYFTSGLYKSQGYNQIPNLPDEYAENYRRLSNLSETNFYRFIVQECSYFGAYMR